MGAVVSCVKAVLQAIGSVIMAIISGIGAILQAIIGGVVAVFGAIVSCLTCGRSGKSRGIGHSHRSSRVI